VFAKETNRIVRFVLQKMGVGVHLAFTSDTRCCGSHISNTFEVTTPRTLRNRDLGKGIRTIFFKNCTIPAHLRSIRQDSSWQTELSSPLNLQGFRRQVVNAHAWSIAATQLKRI